MLARMISLLGPFPPSMLEGGRETGKYFTAAGTAVFAHLPVASEREAELLAAAAGQPLPPRGYALLHSRRTNLTVRLGGPSLAGSHSASPDATDPGFLDFLSSLLVLDPQHRPTAAQALKHPWLTGPPLEIPPYVLPAAAAPP